jgi:hypothetical protein
VTGISTGSSCGGLTGVPSLTCRAGRVGLTIAFGIEGGIATIANIGARFIGSTGQATQNKTPRDKPSTADHEHRSTVSRMNRLAYFYEMVTGRRFQPQQCHAPPKQEHVEEP